MRNTYIFLCLCCVVVIMAGCENYDRAVQGVEKGREFIDNAGKKVAETRREAQKSMEKILGKETGRSDEKGSDGQDRKEGREKDKEKD